MNVDPGGWKAVGETTNSKYFLVEEGVLAVLPHPGTVDDRSTAREEVAFQRSYAKKTGQAHAAIILLENVVSQEKDARRVYQTEFDTTTCLGAALVGGTILSRAVGSFFLGVNKPLIPTRLFPTFDEALAWARQLAQRSKEKP
jgi:hypothetical protein